MLFVVRQEAEQAIQCLNGKLALSKKLVVRWAHAQVKVSNPPPAVWAEPPHGLLQLIQGPNSWKALLSHNFCHFFPC